MKLLIVTQIVDRTDPVLGFFHRWILEFAKQVESVEVICLFEGEHTLPKNVRVHSLGKEKGLQPFFVYALRFLSLSWTLRNRYDRVFVHMNVEYVILTGLLWRALSKKIALWYVHGTVSLRLRLALFLSDIVFTTSPESFRIKDSKVHIVGHGIDTEFFSPDPHVARGKHLLSVGRLTKSKHHDLVIRASRLAGRELRIAGEGPEEGALRALAEDLNAAVVFLGGITQEQLRSEYQSADRLIHTSTTGSMDKVVLEAAACDCDVITTTHGIYNEWPVMSVDATPEAIAQAIKTTTPYSFDRVESVRKKFSLSALIPRIISKLS